MKNLTLIALLLLCSSAAWGQERHIETCDELPADERAWCVDWSPPANTVIATCDGLQPPTDGDWDAYEKAVKACRGELMAEYVMRAARSHWGDWCNHCEPSDDTSGLVFCTAMSCSGLPPQDRIDALAKDLLDDDKALLRRLLRLMAAGVTQ